MKAFTLVPAVAILLAACGGSEPADSPSTEPAPAAQPAAPAAAAAPAIPGGELTVPDWYVVDHDAQTVQLRIIAGETPANNYWNFNGAIRGELAVTVPVGYTVTMELENRDPNMAHSVGISSELSNFQAPPAPTPVFEGAISSNPQSMIDATMPGETESFTFVASTAGDYSMVCYIAGHTTVGMWLYFVVSDAGEAGVRGL